MSYYTATHTVESRLAVHLIRDMFKDHLKRKFCDGRKDGVRHKWYLKAQNPGASLVLVCGIKSLLRQHNIKYHKINVIRCGYCYPESIAITFKES